VDDVPIGLGYEARAGATLAVHVRREAFDAILANAVHSSFVPDVYGREEDWRAAVTTCARPRPSAKTSARSSLR
jgi:hypothetical protein